MMTSIIILGIISVLSVIFNIVLVWYAKSSLSRIDALYTASEEASEIFSMIDTYAEHLGTVYETPTFYGDETLQGLLEHTKQMIEYLKKYEEVYSFTQPDLEEQLLAASKDMQNYEYEQEETQETQEQ